MNQSTRFLLYVLLVMLTLVVSNTVSAQQIHEDEKDAEKPATNAQASAEFIGPFVNEQTIAVARLDLSRFDANAVKETILRVGGEEIRESTEASAERLNKLLGELREAGCQEMFFVVSVEFPAVPGVLVIPVNKQGRGEEVLKLIKSNHLDREFNLRRSDTVYEQGEGLVFVGSRDLLERARNARDKVHPELAAAFTAAGEATIQVLFLPTDDQRRVLRELRPALPEQWGGGDLGVLGELRFASFSLDLPPTLRVSFNSQATTGAAAEELKELWMRLSKAIASRPDVKKELPGIDNVLAAFKPEVKDNMLRAQPDGESLSALVHAVVVPAVVAARAEAKRNATIHQLKQIGFAFHSHHDLKLRFPAHASYNDKGQPLLSWRVHLLPYLGEEEKKLFQEFKLDEPWDSEHNRKLIPRMPAVFARIDGSPRESGKTTLLVPTGKELIFHGIEGSRFRDITDGTSKTILAVAVLPDKAVIWTKPADLEVDPKQTLKDLSGQPDGIFLALFVDGSVRVIPDQIDPQTLWEIFTPADGKSPDGY